MKRIVIAGGGFVGLRVARLVARRLRREAKVILVDRNERFVFSPWLIDALAGDMDAQDYSEPYATAATRGGFEFVRGEIQGVNRRAKILDVRRADGSAASVGYDLLLVCPGAKPAYYGIQGAERATFPLKTFGHVEKIHHALKELATKARTATPEERKRLLHIIVVGGGPTGIEALFSMKTYLERHILCDMPALTKDLSFTIIEGGSKLLSNFPACACSGAQQELERQGVHVKTNMLATAIENGTLHASGETFTGGLILWCAGVQPNDVSFQPDVTRDEKHCPKVGPDLRMEESIYGAGDAIVCSDTDGKPAPRTAQTAMMQADHLAHSLVRVAREKNPKPYVHRPKGSIIVLGDTGYIELPWFTIKTRLTIPLRRAFYRFRFWQMTGR